jgi:hypothetical protein
MPEMLRRPIERYGKLMLVSLVSFALGLAARGGPRVEMRPAPERHAPVATATAPPSAAPPSEAPHPAPLPAAEWPAFHPASAPPSPQPVVVSADAPPRRSLLARKRLSARRKARLKDAALGPSF